MKQYLDLMQDTLDNGVERGDRTGTGTLSVFGRQMRFDLQEGFPLVTTKKTHWKSIAGEQLWFLTGSTNINFLKENGIKIWDAWADEHGELGPVYGKQWRHWQTGPNDHPGIDQIGAVIKSIKENPDSRRHLVSAWNVADIDQMALPPCHFAMQFYVADGKLSCMFSMRSVDIFLGMPFDIASYALLTHMIAHITNLKVGELVASFGDTHLYLNHLDQAREQLSRSPRPLPTLKINRKVENIDDFTLEDFTLEGYNHHSAIKAPIAV